MMSRIFNVNGSCDQELHYMVDISERLHEIKTMVDDGQYFAINRARQYGKTTILAALAEFLKQEYTVISLDFQVMSYVSFEDEGSFVTDFAGELLDNTEYIPTQIKDKLIAFNEEAAKKNSLLALFKVLSMWCGIAERKIVLIIDEVDTATNNQVFLDFLAQLRAYYLRRRKTPTFQSVILAGVYDVRNMKQKIRMDAEHKLNSPWNIAASFRVDLSFSVQDIEGMLDEYEAVHHVGMNVNELSQLIYDYTSGYPYLVSWLCKNIDERIAGSPGFPDKRSAWTGSGLVEAVKQLLVEVNTLFDSLTGKLNDYPELKNMIYRLLFQGQSIAYNPDDPAIRMALMFGFVKVKESYVVVANRIFETRLYNMFLTLAEAQNSEIYKEASRQKNQFIRNGRLDVELILNKFVTYFDDIYGDQNQRFLEEDGRRYFMLYLKPIINGTGNYYIEARTRNNERMDMIIDYHGEQYVIEMKIWNGDAYHTRGEKQLSDYLDYYHLKKGYMLSFNFNKNKNIGVHEIVLGDKVLIEAVV